MGKGTVVISSQGDSAWESVGSSGSGYEHWVVACKR
jgi:hypothetical protein